MKSTTAIIAIVVGTLAAAIVVAQKPAPTVVDVFRSPTCGCCMKWVDHLRSGFRSESQDLEQDALDRSRLIRRTAHRAVVPTARAGTP